jgi:RNA-directed DNA polymerase
MGATFTDPARSKTLRMSGSNLHRSWEVSMMPGAVPPGGAGKVKDRNPAIHVIEKSDTPIVPKKAPNKGQPHAHAGASSAEAVEGRGVSQGEC